QDARRPVHIEALLLPALDGPGIEAVALGESPARQALARPQSAQVSSLDQSPGSRGLANFARHRCPRLEKLRGSRIKLRGSRDFSSCGQPESFGINELTRGGGAGIWEESPGNQAGVHYPFPTQAGNFGKSSLR